MRFTKRVAGHGHVTVPNDLRAALDIDGGDLVEFEVVGIVRRQVSPPSIGVNTPVVSKVNTA